MRGMFLRSASGLLAVVGVLLSGPAGIADSSFNAPGAVDHRPCVSKREFNAAAYQERKDVLEARWEVAGLGRQTVLPVVGRVTIYPRCAYSLDEAWYGVQYARRGDGHLWMVGQTWWNEPGAEPHGRP